MVKGVSRQVILVKAPDQRLFEQAIYILKDDAPEVTEEMLLKEAKALVRSATHSAPKRREPVWAAVGAGITGLLWLLSTIL